MGAASTIAVFLRGTDDCGPHCCNRLFEWAMGASMVLVGAGLFIWPSSLIFGNLHQLLRVISEFTLAVVLLYIGLLRIGCLVSNGALPWIGPIVRSGCATIGAFVLSQMAWALATNGATPMPPGVFIFAVLALAELVSAYRASSDARERGRRDA